MPVAAFNNKPIARALKSIIILFAATYSALPILSNIEASTAGVSSYPPLQFQVHKLNSLHRTRELKTAS